MLLDLAPLTLDAGADVAAAAQQLYSLLDARAAAGDGVSDRAQVRIGLAASPLTDAFSGASGVELDDAVALATAAAARTETVRALMVDGTAFHNAGAGDAEELGAAIAAGVEYLRALTAQGLTISEALGQLEFRLAATDDQFQTLAKFRAGRQVWARVAQVCGASEFGGAVQHAVTSAAMMSQRDPWVNMLRTTLAAFGAGVGGADSVTVLPFDVALPAGAAGVSKSFSERIARNTQLLLLEESHLGRVLDPGAGSWYVEQLTEEIAAKAWEFFQQIEAAGGYRAALAAVSSPTGSPPRSRPRRRHRASPDRCHRHQRVPEPERGAAARGGRRGRSRRLRHSVARYASAFEALRDRSDAYLAANGARPQVLLAPLGSVAEHNVRTTFAANLLASGGIEAVNPGPLDPADGGIATAVKESGTKIAVLCGTDKRYGEQGAAAVTALREAGIEQVLLAGPRRSLPTSRTAPRVPTDSSPPASTQSRH